MSPTGCNNWQTNGAKVWFKVQEDGLHSTNPDWLKNVWGVTPLLTAPNNGVNYTIPRCLKSGKYLVRHELIALHNAYSVGGAQFYPG